MKLQTLCDNIGKYGCLAICYCYIAGRELGIDNNDLLNALAFQTIYECVGTEALHDDMFVEDPVSIIRKAAQIAGNKELYPNIEKKTITSFKDLMGDSYAAVELLSNTTTHFVVAEYGLKVYDPLEYSYVSKYGNPISARIVSFK